MKYNIEKLQNGGGFATFTPIIYSQPATSSSKSESKTDSKKSISSVLDDETFKELVNQGGLVNDVNSLVSDLVKLESSSNSLYPYTQSNTRSSALKMIGKINELKRNKSAWEDAMKTSKDSGGLNEVAVDSSGYMYTKGEDGKISQISYEGYLKNKDKSRVLSVAELLNERQYNPQLVGQNSIFDVANNSIGLNKITEHVNTIINSLGKETTTSNNFYSKQQIVDGLKSITGKKASDEELSALQDFKQVLQTPGEYYKIISTSSSQRNHLDKALNYIWKTLGTSAQQKLTATAVLNGESNPRKFIGDMLSSQTSTSTSREISPEKLPGSTNPDGSSSEKAVTPFEILHNGKTGDRPFLWNDPSSNKKMVLHATGVAPITTLQGKRIGMSTLNDVLKSEVGTLVKTQDAYFGDQKIELNDLNNIIYDGSDAVRVMMPVNGDGSPNYNLLKQFNEVQEEVNKHKADWSTARAQQEYKNRGFNNVVIGDDFIAKPTSDVKPFLLMYGYTAEGANSTKNNGQIKTLNSEEQSEISTSLKDIWKKEKINAPTGWWDWSTTYYKGPIAIPYRDDSSIYAASISGNITAPKTSLQDARVKMQTNKGQIVNGSSSFFDE